MAYRFDSRGDDRDTQCHCRRRAKDTEMIERRKDCPNCGSKFLATDTEYVYCLTCIWKVKAKREVARVLPKMADIQREWR